MLTRHVFYFKYSSMYVSHSTAVSVLCIHQRLYSKYSNVCTLHISVSVLQIQQCLYSAYSSVCILHTVLSVLYLCTAVCLLLAYSIHSNVFIQQTQQCLNSANIHTLYIQHGVCTLHTSVSVLYCKCCTVQPFLYCTVPIPQCLNTTYSKQSICTLHTAVYVHY